MSTYDAIEVVIHPQSVVHSAVRFVDGSLKAQLGTPDMRTPDPVRPDLPRPPPVAGRRRRPRRGRPPRLPRARRGPLPGAADRPRGRPDRAARDGRADRRRRGRGRPVPRRHARLPGIPRLLEAAVARFGERRRTRRRTSRSSSRSTPRSARPSPTARSEPARERPLRAVARHDRPLLRHPRRARPHPRARPLRHRPPGRRPRPRVRHRLPAAGQGPADRAARPSTRSTGCRSAASSSSRARTATTPTIPRSFVARAPAVKLVILVAGVAMNLVLAFADLHRRSPGSRRRSSASGSATVQPGSPAATAGLQAGDAIVALDGERVRVLRRGRPILAGRSAPAPARPWSSTIERPTARRDQTSRSTLRTAGARSTPTTGALGISGNESVRVAVRRHVTGRDLPSAIRSARAETSRWFGLILGGLGDLATRSRPTRPRRRRSPARSGSRPRSATSSSAPGPIVTLYVAGILSANLALVNILPFPPLDGGRMLMIVAEVDLRRRGSASAPSG